MKQAIVSSYVLLTFIVLIVTSIGDAVAQQDDKAQHHCLDEIRKVLLKLEIKHLEKGEEETVIDYCEQGDIKRAASYVMTLTVPQKCKRGLNDHIKSNEIDVDKSLYANAYERCKRDGDLQESITLLARGETDVDMVPAENISFVASSNKVYEGGPVTLSWRTVNANTVMLGRQGETDFRPVETSGSQTVTPDKTTTYVLMVGQSTKGRAEMTSKSLKVDIIYDPVIGKYLANPSTIRKGQKSELIWQVYAADEVTLNDKAVAHIGEKMVSPEQSQRYTLKAWTDDKLIKEHIMVTVSPYQIPQLSHPFYELELCREINKSGASFRCVSPDGPFWRGDKVSVIARFKNLAGGKHTIKRTIYGSGTLADKEWKKYHQEKSSFQNTSRDSGEITFDIPSEVTGALKLELILDNNKNARSVIHYCVECPGHDEW